MVNKYFKWIKPVNKNRYLNYVLVKWNKVPTKLINKHVFNEYDSQEKTFSLNNEKRDKMIIVSLTSMPKRLNVLPYTIESLLRQTYKPDKVILWIEPENYDLMNNDQKLNELKLMGLEICKCDEDLKPHKKYYYAFKKYPEHLVITVDDDILYPPTFVEKLMIEHFNHPNDIICYRAHEIRFNEDGNPQPYLKWNLTSPGIKGPNKWLCPTGVGGVLYQPKFFDEELFNLKAIKETCLFADDLWLKFIEIMSDINIVKVYENCIEPVELGDSQDSALFKTNVNENRNDVQLKKILDYYNIKSLRQYKFK